MNIKYLSICLTLVATLFVSNVIAADSTAPAATDATAPATDATAPATTDATAPATTDATAPATKKQKKANS